MPAATTRSGGRSCSPLRRTVATPLELVTNAPPEKVEVGAAYAAGSDLHRGEVAVPVEGRGQAGDGGRTAVEFKAR